MGVLIMQTPEVQILAFLTHYEVEDVKKAIKSWAMSKLLTTHSQVDLLAAQGWTRISEKPTNQEYIFAFGEYFIQHPEEKKKLEQAARKNRIIRERIRLKTICPKCTATSLRLYPVNDTNRTMVGGNWKSQWACPDINCGFEKYSTRSVKEELEHLKKENENGTR